MRDFFGADVTTSDSENNQNLSKSDESKKKSEKVIRGLNKKVFSSRDNPLDSQDINDGASQRKSKNGSERLGLNQIIAKHSLQS